MGVGELVQVPLRPLVEAPAGIGEGERPRRADEERDTQILLQRIDLANDRRRRHGASLSIGTEP